MKINLSLLASFKKPMYILYEDALRKNLALIKNVAKKADVNIILAFKAYSLWRTFPIFREYISATTASSLYEAKLGFEEFGSPTHTYSPAYTDYEIDEIAKYSSHLVFNSISQYRRLHERVKEHNSNLSIGIRINPQYSEVDTLLYNPCAPGTRFGITADELPQYLPNDIEGFHVHCHCESGSDVFERTLNHIELLFDKWFNQIKWINFGGGHLMTRKGYDIDKLIYLLTDFKNRWSHLNIILEPGSAFAWQTGILVAQVVDIVFNESIATAILNISFTCHTPDCLEMPYQPIVYGAKIVDDSYKEKKNVYRLGGNSCLSGDWLGYWQFDHELQIGETIVFDDMLHYTTVKTTMFNGITHPSIALLRSNGELKILKRFNYSDYRSRMD